MIASKMKGNSIISDINSFEFRILFSEIGRLLVILIVFPSREILEEVIEVTVPPKRIR